MSTARFLVGDVFERMAELPDGAYDLIITSPPFLALRSYLPDGHPDKGKEIGSEATPAEFLDTMLALTAEWGRLLAPHGSIAIEIGDTYSGSGGGGGDYYENGLRAGQPGFTGSASASRDALREANAAHWRQKNADKDAWPLAKSLAMIPELYAASLAYGRNLLTGAESPAGRWRVRNFKPWIRSNPPVGALGDKERPATSYITVATRAVDRYFDLDSVRTAAIHTDDGPHARTASTGHADGARRVNRAPNGAGAPPLDWVHDIDIRIDAVIDHEIDQRAGKTGQGGGPGPARATKLHGGAEGNGVVPKEAITVGARGVHIRRALEQAGILTTLDAYDISPKGYSGSHYAVWPKELVRRLVDEMCPRRVCTTCGQPSRRLTSEPTYHDANGREVEAKVWPSAIADGRGAHSAKTDGNVTRSTRTLGWSDCGHDTWRPGRILDPFVGSGTTLAVATGMARDADGIDLDPRNAHLARDRVGMFLEIHDKPTAKQTA